MTYLIANTSQRNTARLAGLLYLILAITGAYSLFYVPSQIIVSDVVVTSNNILAHEFLFRMGITVDLISQVTAVVLVLVLYRLFKDVNEPLAKLMVAFVIVQVPVAFVIESFNITSLMILKGEVLKTLDLNQKYDFALLLRQVRHYEILLLEIFWGLWMLPLGVLAYKSGFIPRILGVLFILGGIGYVIDSLVFLLLPDYHAFISQFLFVNGLTEIALILWLLIKGVKDKQTQIAGEQ